jgi:hydroxyethylthiazole kinase-like uncharacterized protein yjeF
VFCMSLSESSSMSPPQISMTETASLYLPEQVMDIDHYAIKQLGVPAVVLMKHAGRCAVHALLERWPNVCCLHVFCGSGNNAGDGYVVAALAKQRCLDVTVWTLSDPDRLKGAAYSAYCYALQEGVECRPYETSSWQCAIQSMDNTVIVDGLLGTGAKGEPLPAYAMVIDAINQSGCSVMALDIPSGVDASTGDVSTVAVQAELTLSFVGQKRGLFTGAGREYSGIRQFTDLNIPLDVYERQQPIAQLIQVRDWLGLLPQRTVASHKGQCGHVVIVGGDCGTGYGYGGAAIMAAEMALRTGAGLVSLVTRPAFVAPALARHPEMMVAGVDNGQALLATLKRVSGVVIGPGLGQSAWSEQLLYHALQTDKPLVLDADALHLLARSEFAALVHMPLEERRWILTPHPGEAASLLGVTVEDIQKDRFAAAASIQQRYGGAVVLKGAGTIVTASTGEQWLCDYGNPGMASGGMGDVLSGLLGSLLVQGMTHNAAALLGTSLHSLAADKVAQQQGQRGLLATDLIAPIRRWLDGCGELDDF